ncbi:bifunctional DNA primase/polymerase [Methylobacterium oryzae]|uniref:Protein of unassigned function n=1 Tax=Methylobacterium oryzae CBMB20 TaxID=693986 RepID=A0A089NSQ9_9HYPH|nr:bifunctional DNA primase/polymerase [Methylobacterium oryzae]AIQ89590.1 protein of unassigned function [Methylobacterium oryzae CBMB20]
MTPASPRSGVDRLTALDVRLQMRANGWPSIPITPHDEDHKSAGKRPAIRDWQRHAVYDEKAPLPLLREVESVARRYPDAQGTGIPCGSVIGIDIDVSDPALVGEIEAMAVSAFGPTPFVREGRAPRRLLVYRAEEAMPKSAHKALNGGSDGIDIQAVGSQFVAFGIHQVTRRPYRWLGESPLTASPEAAPEITAEKVTAFLSLVNGVLPLSASGSGRKRTGGGGFVEVVRDAEGFVIDGREQHMTNVVWRAACRLSERGEPLTLETLTDAAWANFQATARTIVEGREWTKAEAEAKARATLDRVKRGLAKLPAKREAVAPTYPDDARALTDAEAAVRAGADEFFERYAPEYRNALAIFNGGGALLQPMPRGKIFRIEAGVGKTDAAVVAAARAIRAGLSVVFAVPRVDLGDELATRLARQGIIAHVWRGRERPDPEAPKTRMCLNPSAVDDAREAGAWSIAATVCEQQDTKARRIVRCPHFETCGYMRQREAAPQAWIVTHAMLFLPLPAAIGRVDALAIDEAFVSGGIAQKPVSRALDEIEGAGVLAGSENASKMKAWREALIRAARASEDGPLSHAALAAAGLTADDAASARGFEQARYADPGITPLMEPRERKRRAAETGASNKLARDLIALWDEIAAFLDGETPKSGRMRLARDPESGARIIELRPLTTVHASWRAPTLILDATAPPPSVIEPVLGLEVDEIASIAAEWSPHRFVRQIVGAPVSSTKLGLTGKGEGNARTFDDLRRLIVLRAALAYPRDIAIVAQATVEERLAGMGLPANVVMGHFNGLSGRNDMEAVAGMIVIGQAMPPIFSMEADAGTLTGVPVEVADTVLKPGERRWYPRVPGAIRLRDGSSHPVDHYRHSDPTVEALRWQICEGQLIQAIGRLRPLRRGPDESFFLDIVSNVPLPITVDRVEEWSAVRLGAWADMAAEGVVLTAASDIQAAFPDLAASAKAAQNMSEAVRLTLRSNIDSYIDLGVSVSLVEVKRAGRYAPTEIVALPNGPRGPNSLKRWLSERGLGPIERITVKRAGKAWARPSFARVGRLIDERTHDWACMLATASECASKFDRSARNA